MNCETETLLLQEVAPRLRAAIPKTVPMVGPDDPEELLQDGLAIAIGLLQSAQRAGKKVSPGNIARCHPVSALLPTEQRYGAPSLADRGPTSGCCACIEWRPR